MTTEYDEVAYPSLPLHNTRPAQMAVQAKLRGLSCPPPSAARILEIGCSDAGNLAALAAYSPRAHFVGVDLSATAVARAQQHRLPNLQVVQGDLIELDAGEFDYVIAHGVYSWVPDPDALLSCIDRHLARDGVAYVSFNAMPGWLLRRLAADVLQREVGGDAAAARALGEELLAVDAKEPAAQAMQTALRLVLGKPDHVLHHDDLDVHARGFYIDDVAQAAAAHGLRYIGEAHLADCAPWADDVVRAEVLHDYRVNRMFRSSLFARTALGPPRADVLGGMWVSAPVAPRGGRSFEMLRGVQVEVDEVLAADLRRLGAAWPGAVPGHELQADPAAFLTLYASRAIDLSCEPVPVVPAGSHPFVAGYMRQRAIDGQLLATFRHDPLRLEDDRSRQAVSMMDGEHSRAQIAAALRTGPEDRVRKDLDALIDALSRKGLFVRPPGTSAG